jgi:vacuolar-type H+-ATPase subunit I/STV1
VVKISLDKTKISGSLTGATRSTIGFLRYLVMSEPEISKETVENLTEEIEKSKEESKRLRNLYEELKSKITVENAWRRYLQYRLNRVRNGESDNK